SGTVVCLPEDPGEDDLLRLVRVAQDVLAAPDEGDRFIVVQRNGGGSAFARTLQLEARKLVVRVVDVPFAHPGAPEWIAAEAAAAGGYREARYDGDGRRHEPEMRLLSTGDADPVAPLGPGDVLLVSGGGKGITAECALDLARAYGVKVALLGRSRPEEDPALAANLARFADGATPFTYRSVDVTQEDRVREAVADIERELGPVTAILHGAGRNEPRLIPALDRESLRATLAPKVDGLDHLLAAVGKRRLRLVVAFGSIIGRLGLEGEADYAVANERMTRRLRAFRSTHPACRCVVVDWSVWSGVGMGERLGRMESLAAAGVTPIPPEGGIAFLRALLERGFDTLDPIVCGRFGSLPTAPVARAPLPFARFLETVRVHTPGVELVVDADISRGTDPYLDDHVFRGDRVFPAVMMLEMMAQTVAALTNESTASSFERIEFRSPIVVPSEGTLALRCAALVQADGTVDLVLRCSATGFQTDHCVATARRPEPVRDDGVEPEAPTGGAGFRLDPARDLYGTLLFHGGRFRRLERYLDLGARRCVAEISPNGKSKWFDRTFPETLWLGDPSVRDAALHAIQACVPQATILPVGAESVEILPGDPAPANGDGAAHTDTRFVKARERSRDGRVFTYDLEIVDGAGRCRERWRGLRLAIVDEDAGGPWMPELLGPYLERRLGELDPGAMLGVALAGSEGNGSDAPDGRGERRDRALTLLRPGVSLAHAPNGRPEIPGDPG
ncbi:SDR family NAD(P)-dependent oxidoreductase, partial [bacterium]|nr:SDR family NAD(P)-dependent oxidoreductase [bacterium]